MRGFSIIVCCYNGAFRLRKVIQVLSKLIVADFLYEIIIVDNNSNDETYNMALDLAEESETVKIHVIQEKKTGKSNALITGFNIANFEYLLICDDDNLLNSDYLLVADSIFRQYPNIGIIGGKGILPENYHVQKWFNAHENAWAIGSQHILSDEIKGAFPSVWGAGMLIRKSTWDRLIDYGFKCFITGKTTNAVTMAGEDTELCLLVKSIGYGIYFDEKLIYIHALNSERITWNHLLEMKTGFTRSQVYFDFYKMYLTGNLKTILSFKNQVIKQLYLSFKVFFSGYRTLNFYKALYIGFIENREGYQLGIEKRNQITRIRELFNILFKYKSVYSVFSSFLVTINE